MEDKKPQEDLIHLAASTDAESCSEFRRVTLLILGCGSRGTNYASYAKIYPDKARVVAISDTRALARKKFLNNYATIDAAKVFSHWSEALDAPEKLADCVVIALPDQDHKDAAIAFTNKGTTHIS